MQYAHRRRLTVAVIASGTVLVTLAAFGAVGLIRGQQDLARLRPSGPDLHVFSEPMDPVSHPRPIPTSSDAETFARSVGRALFTWDTRYDGGVSEWAQVIVDVAAVSGFRSTSDPVAIRMTLRAADAGLRR